MNQSPRNAFTLNLELRNARGASLHKVTYLAPRGTCLGVIRQLLSLSSDPTQSIFGNTTVEGSMHSFHLILRTTRGSFVPFRLRKILARLGNTSGVEKQFEERELSPWLEPNVTRIDRE